MRDPRLISIGRYLFVIVVLSAADSPVGAASGVYSREDTFSAVRLSYADLTSLLDKVQDLITKLNHNADLDPRNLLTVGDGTVTLTLRPPVSLDALRTAPAISTRVRFAYLAPRGGGISSFILDFSDDARNVRIEGETAGAVDALSALVNREMQSLTTMFGGRGFRFLVFGFVGLAAWTLLTVNYYKGGKRVFPPSESVRAIGFFGLLGVAARNLFYSWFPGTVVYSSNPSFGVQYAGEIALVGLFLAVVGIALTIYFGRPQAPSPKP